MDLFERAKSLADQATTRAKEGVEEAKLMLDLRRGYDELGKLTFELVGSGEVENPKLQPVVDRIRELEADLKRRRGAESSEPPGDAAPAG